MLTIIFLIFAISIDAMSFGLSQGLMNVKIKLSTSLIITIISTILFSIPLYLSKYIATLFNQTTLNLINGMVLIFLGIHYLIQYIKQKRIYSKDKNKNKSTLTLSAAILSTFPISLDAIFTALLNGCTIQYLNLTILIYFCFTIISIFLCNIIGLLFSDKTYINLGFLSSLIFIVIGILKILNI